VRDDTQFVPDGPTRMTIVPLLSSSSYHRHHHYHHHFRRKLSPENAKSPYGGGPLIL
jgi:hypothetical protein